MRRIYFFNFIKRMRKAFFRLLRDRKHKIKAEICKSRILNIENCPVRVIRTVNAPKCLKLVIVKRLNAQAYPVHAQIIKLFQQAAADCPGICLNSKFIIFGKRKSFTQGVYYPYQIIAQNGRRSAADVNCFNRLSIGFIYFIYNCLRVIVCKRKRAN